MLNLYRSRGLPKTHTCLRNVSLKVNNLDPALRPNEVISYFEADSGHTISRQDQRQNMVLNFKNDTTVNEIMDNRTAINMGDNRKLFFQKISDLPPQIILQAPTQGNVNFTDYRNNESLSSAFVSVFEKQNLVSFTFKSIEDATAALNSDIHINGERLNLFVPKNSRFSLDAITLFLGGIPLNVSNEEILSHPAIAGNLVQVKTGKSAKFCFLYCTDLDEANKLVETGLTINGTHIKPDTSGVGKSEFDKDISLTVFSDNEFSDNQLSSLGNANQIQIKTGYITFINDVTKEEAKKLILNGVNIDGTKHKVQAKRESVKTKIFRLPLEANNSDIERALDGQMYNLYQGKNNKLGFVSFFDEADANAFTSIKLNGKDFTGELKDDNPKESYKHIVFVDLNTKAFPNLSPEALLSSKKFVALNSKAEYQANAFTDKRGQTVGLIKCKNYFAAKDLCDEGIQVDGRWATVNLKPDDSFRK